MVYVWRCTYCGHEVEITRSVADCKLPPEDTVRCLCNMLSHKKSEWQRVYTPAMITKASYPDGVRKFTELREASKLQRESNASSDKKRKKEIAAEIKKMGVRLGK